MLWQKQLLKDGVAADVLDFAVPLADGGFLVSGSTFTSTFPPTAIDLLVRVNSAGAIVWQKEYSRPVTDTLSSFGVQELADGSLLQSGAKFTRANGFRTPTLVSQAQLHRRRAMGHVRRRPGGRHPVLAYAGQRRRLISAGTTRSWVPPGDSFGNIWIVKLDTNVNVDAQKSFGGNGSDTGASWRSRTGTS